MEKWRNRRHARKIFVDAANREAGVDEKVPGANETRRGENFSALLVVRTLVNQTAYEIKFQISSVGTHASKTIFPGLFLTRLFRISSENEFSTPPLKQDYFSPA